MHAEYLFERLILLFILPFILPFGLVFGLLLGMFGAIAVSISLLSLACEWIISHPVRYIGAVVITFSTFVLGDYLGWIPLEFWTFSPDISIRLFN